MRVSRKCVSAPPAVGARERLQEVQQLGNEHDGGDGHGFEGRADD
jgi:hypothetical protein